MRTISGIQTDDGQALLAELGAEPGRSCSGLQPDADRAGCMGSDQPRKHPRIGRHLAFENTPSGLVQHANTGLLERHIESDILTHAASGLITKTEATGLRTSAAGAI